MSYQKGMVLFTGKKSVVNSGKKNSSASKKDLHTCSFPTCRPAALHSDLTCS